MIAIAIIVLALCALVKVAHGDVRRLKIHQPRALQLLAGDPGASSERPRVPHTLAEAVMHGCARIDGTCTRCGGAWNPAHGDAPHPTWARPVPRPARAEERLD